MKNSLKGFSKEWNPFIKGISTRYKLLDWNMLCDDFIQEELRDEYLHKKKKSIQDRVALA